MICDKASVAIAEALGYPHITIARSPVADLKAVKNATEIEGFRASHIRDGSALVRYFAWLEEQLNSGHELSESQGADQLEKFRGRVFLHLYLVYGDLLVASRPESLLCSKACRLRPFPRLGPTQVCKASITVVMSSVPWG